MHTTLLICSLLALSLTPTQQDATQFPAVVSKTEAVFSLPVQSRSRWSWNRRETPNNMREYQMDVTVKNESGEYTFGFYLWKHPGASAGSGSLSDLISTGQKSLFERTEQGLMTVVRDADVKVKVKGDLVVISLHSSKDLERLFSSRPTEAVCRIKYPGEQETSQTVQIVYQ